MRKVFYSSAVFASLFLAVQGCNDPHKIDVPEVKVETPDPNPKIDLSDVKFNVGCNLKDSEMRVSNEADAAGIVVEKDVKMKKTQSVDCNGKVVYVNQQPAGPVFSEVEYQADIERLDEVESIEIENLRSCAKISLVTSAPGESRPKGSDGLPVSEFHSDGQLKLVIQQFSPVEVILGLGQMQTERTHVFEGLNLIQVRFLGAGGELLDTKEFRLDFKPKAILMPTVETESTCVQQADT